MLAHTLPYLVILCRGGGRGARRVRGPEARCTGIHTREHPMMHAQLPLTTRWSHGLVFLLHEGGSPPSFPDGQKMQASKEVRVTGAELM